MRFLNTLDQFLNCGKETLNQTIISVQWALFIALLGVRWRRRRVSCFYNWLEVHYYQIPYNVGEPSTSILSTYDWIFEFTESWLKNRKKDSVRIKIGDHPSSFDRISLWWFVTTKSKANAKPISVWHFVVFLVPVLHKWREERTWTRRPSFEICLEMTGLVLVSGIKVDLSRQMPYNKRYRLCTNYHICSCQGAIHRSPSFEARG